MNQILKIAVPSVVVIYATLQYFDPHQMGQHSAAMRESLHGQHQPPVAFEVGLHEGLPFCPVSLVPGQSNLLMYNLPDENKCIGRAHGCEKVHLQDLDKWISEYPVGPGRWKRLCSNFDENKSSQTSHSAGFGTPKSWCSCLRRGRLAIKICLLLPIHLEVV